MSNHYVHTIKKHRKFETLYKALALFVIELKILLAEFALYSIELGTTFYLSLDLLLFLNNCGSTCLSINRTS